MQQYYRDDPNVSIADSESSKFRARATGRTLADGKAKDVEIAVPLKYLSILRRALEMSLITCEINPVLTLSVNRVITNSTGARLVAITGAKRHVPAVTLSTQDNKKLLEQLKSGFKHTICQYKFLSKVLVETQNHY